MRSNTTTNLDEVKSVAKRFLNMEIQETEFSFLASHPFTSYWTTGIYVPGKNEPDIGDLHDPKTAERWRKGLESLIENSTLIRLFMLLNKPYRLTFLLYTESSISDFDLGKVLPFVWEVSENCNGKSSENRKILALFKRADKSSLMSESELQHYHSLPEIVRVYRGINKFNSRSKTALSWTLDKSVAEWFANRFSSKSGTGGEVWSISIPKQRIVCCFDSGENEVIVDTYGMTSEITKEKAD